MLKRFLRYGNVFSPPMKKWKKKKGHQGIMPIAICYCLKE